MKTEKIIFLDRDGVINRPAEEHKYILNWKMFEFLPGFVETFQKIGQLNYKLIIITNQQCIGKGLISESELNSIHKNMLETLNLNNISIHKIYYCPHLIEENCPCRKPKPGMLFKAKKDLDLNIDYNCCYFIGDNISDIDAGKTFGCKTILLSSTLPVYNQHKVADYIVSEFSQLLNIIT